MRVYPEGPEGVVEVEDEEAGKREGVGEGLEVGLWWLLLLLEGREGGDCGS